MAAWAHEQTHIAELRDQELAGLQASKQRGSLTIQFDPEMVRVPPPTGKRSSQPQDSDAAIQACLTRKVFFGIALRQTAGVVESLLRLARLDWCVPDFSPSSRRQKTLAVNIPYRGSVGSLQFLIDSTGIKAGGEGGWNAPKHGGTKRRLWRKIHLGVDERTLEIRAILCPAGDLPSKSAEREIT